MGTGFETWVTSHNVERNNKTLITPQLVQFLNMQWLKTSLEFQGQLIILLQTASKKIGARPFIKHLMINVPNCTVKSEKKVFNGEENNRAFSAKCCLCNTNAQMD